MRRVLIYLCLLLLQSQLALAQSYEYWLDNDYDSRTVVSGSGMSSLSVDLSSLSKGIHYFNFQTKGIDGQRGGMYRYLFYLNAPTDTAEPVGGGEYWIDNDYEARHIVNGSMDAPLTVDLSNLSEGVHYFNFRAKNSAGQWGGMYRYLVYISHTEQAREDVAKVEYWLDNETDTITRTANTSELTISMDISHLQAGEHEFHCRLHSEGGKKSDIYSYTFSLEQSQGIDVTFDGLVLSVNSDVNMKNALEYVGGRDSVASTIAAITWNSRIPLTDADLQGITNPNLLIYVNSRELAPQGFENVIANGVARSITLTDAAEGNSDFYCPIGFTAESIIYERVFRQETETGVSRGWETLVLPFDVQTVIHERNGLLCPFGSTVSDTHFWLRQLTSGGLARATQITANTPYLISMPNSSEYHDEYNLAGRVIFAAEDVAVPATPQASERQVTAGSVTLVPALQRVAQSDSVYALNVGTPRGSYAEGSVFERGLREVRPFECYTLHSATGSGAPRFIPLSNGMGGTTGIQEIEDVLAGHSAIYDLTGRKIADGQSGNGHLTRGIYITNGRKVMVK